MVSFKELRGLGAAGSSLSRLLSAAIFSAFLAGSAAAETCIAPQPPFVPGDPEAAREYSDIIRNDFELYIRDIEQYFRCLDNERARAFEEAREVSAAYGRFLEMIAP